MRTELYQPSIKEKKPGTIIDISNIKNDRVENTDLPLI